MIIEQSEPDEQSEEFKQETEEQIAKKIKQQEAIKNQAESKIL